MTYHESLPAGSRPLKVAMISHSDMLGGASVVTYRLMKALKAEGVDARMSVYNRLTDDASVRQVGTAGTRGVRFAWERVRIMAANGFRRDDLFKVSTADTGFNLSRDPWIREADVILLGWINQGLLSLDDIEALGRLGKPVVWVMHDMWCLTGICHHSLGCTRYTESCGRCPLLHSRRDNDLSRHVWERKMKLYDAVPLTFVAVSRWLADRCAESSLLAKRDVRVIPNAFPVDSFVIRPRGELTVLQGDLDHDIILMGAARLDDHIKGLPMAVDALNYIFDNHPEVAQRTVAVFFGDLRSSAALHNLRFPHFHVGRINDPNLMRDLYARSKVVLSSSLYETLPGTLIEGQASGCLPVTFGRGGQADIVTHLSDGYIARYADTRDLAKGILWALDQNVDRQALHESVRRRFSSTSVARSYIELFNQLVAVK